MERRVGAIEASGSLESERYVLHSQTAVTFNRRLYWFIFGLFLVGPLLALLLLDRSFRESLSHRRRDAVWDVQIGPRMLRLKHRLGNRAMLRGVSRSMRAAYARHGSVNIPWPEVTSVAVTGSRRQPTLVVETVRGELFLDLHVNAESQPWFESLVDTLRSRAGGLLTVDEVPDSLHELRGRPVVQA